MRHSRLHGFTLWRDYRQSRPATTYIRVTPEAVAWATARLAGGLPLVLTASDLKAMEILDAAMYIEVRAQRPDQLAELRRKYPVVTGRRMLVLERLDRLAVDDDPPDEGQDDPCASPVLTRSRTQPPYAGNLAESLLRYIRMRGRLESPFSSAARTVVPTGSDEHVSLLDVEEHLRRQPARVARFAVDLAQDPTSSALGASRGVHRTTATRRREKLLRDFAEGRNHDPKSRRRSPHAHYMQRGPVTHGRKPSHAFISRQHSYRRRW